MIFYAPAPRNIPPERAKEILSVLPPYVSPVGLYVNAEAAEVLRAAAHLHIRHVQLNGDEPPSTVAALPGLQVVKAIRVDAAFGATLSRWREAVINLQLHNLKGIVLETGNTHQAGGTGVANDWAAVERHRAAGAFDGLPPLIAAGGLTPETVGEVVRTLRPWAVDVSSGVESSKGIKSADKIHAFVRAVREADDAINAQG
jgi:phosphoribosylanthranilate isomerase